MSSIRRLTWGQAMSKQSGFPGLLTIYVLAAVAACAIPIPTLRGWFDNVGEWFHWKFLNDRGVPIDQAANIETHKTEAVPAEMILDIITFNCDRFGQPTGCAGWLDPIG